MSERHYLVMGSPGHVPPGSPEFQLEAMGANAGNLLFQYAVTQLIDGPMVHLGPGGADWADPQPRADAAALIFPAANHLRRGADWTGLNAYLSLPGPPLIVLGLGIQAPSGVGVAEAVAVLNADSQARRFVDILRDRASLITVRGRYTQAVCEGLGLHGTEPLGCPSNFLHPAPDLGARLARRLVDLSAVLCGKGRGLSGAMAASAPFEIRGKKPAVKLEQTLFDWLIGQQQDGLYIQQSGGAVSARAASGQWHDLAASTRAGIQKVLAPNMPEVEFWSRMCRMGRFPTSAADWIAELACRDIVVGTRVHGVLAGLAAGVPGVLIPHDARTDELAETMYLPTLSREAALNATGLGHALQQVDFDGLSFDRARWKNAARLAGLLARNGIRPTRHLAELGGELPLDQVA